MCVCVCVLRVCGGSGGDGGLGGGLWHDWVARRGWVGG